MKKLGIILGSVFMFSAANAQNFLPQTQYLPLARFCKPCLDLI